MKLFDKQSLAIISTAAGSIYQIGENYEFGMEFRNYTDTCYNALEEVLRVWPVSKDYNITSWMHMKMERWRKARNDVDIKKEILEYIAIPLLSIADLHESLKRKIRKGEDVEINIQRCYLLDPIFPLLNDMLYYIDPSGEQSYQFEQNTPLLKKLYDILEFYPQE